MSFDIVITGVGGQGTVLAARVLAAAAMAAGLPVRTSEIIGMAQREGVVMSQVRFGDPLWGALIPDRKADLLLGFEPAEAVRGLPKLKPAGVAVVNTTPVIPVTAALGLSAYDPQACLAYLREKVPRLYLLEASRLAAEAGHPRAVNSVLLGAAAALDLLPFSAGSLLDCLLAAVPEKYREVNRRAFEAGKMAVG
ncbi:MAG: indolepyruvate oxidoreductase subunit beta [Armatimonadetes bacterium]|nr:indolepyruvate oxidoreductase subunit beta [Armatimonadota bacterium]